MSLTKAWPLSETELCSADLISSIRDRLKWWVENPVEHARFLNTLSMMEHIGSRKIMASQTVGFLSCDILKHLAEETRHAFFFKKAAEYLSKAKNGYGHGETLAPHAAKMYFGRLDASISRALDDSATTETPYLYVSLIVELRAIWMYRLYQDVLVHNSSRLSLKSVLAEETLHLDHMIKRLDELGESPAQRIPGFVSCEDKLFRRLWEEIESKYEPLPKVA